MVATGTPEEVAENPASFTGQYLKPVLERAKEREAALAAGELDEEASPAKKPRRKKAE